MGMGVGGRHGASASRDALPMRSPLWQLRQRPCTVRLRLQHEGDSCAGRVASDTGDVFAAGETTMSLQRGVLERVQLRDAAPGALPVDSAAMH
jgi:hypothetical protein